MTDRISSPETSSDERDRWEKRSPAHQLLRRARERDVSTHLCQSTLPLVRHPSHDPPNPLSLLKLLLQAVLPAAAACSPISILRTTGAGSSRVGSSSRSVREGQRDPVFVRSRLDEVGQLDLVVVASILRACARGAYEV